MKHDNITYHIVFETGGDTKHASLEIVERSSDVYWVLETLANEMTGFSSCVGQALADAMGILLASARVIEVMRFGTFRYEQPTADEIRVHTDNSSVARSNQHCGLWIMQEPRHASALVGLRIGENGAIEIHHGVGEWHPMPAGIVAKWWPFDSRRGMVAWPSANAERG